jgi:hypothetical protein
LTSCTAEKPSILDVNHDNSINHTIFTQVPTNVDSINNLTPLGQAYYEGIIVITKYYTLLDHGLYEEAYRLLSENERRIHSLDEYVESARLAFQEVEIISIIPYPEYVRFQGGAVRNPDPPGRKRFTVKISAWGQGKMSGSRMSGELQLLFIVVELEDEVWKIDTFATAPID